MASTGPTARKPSPASARWSGAAKAAADDRAPGDDRERCVTQHLGVVVGAAEQGGTDDADRGDGGEGAGHAVVTGEPLVGVDGDERLGHEK